MSLLSYLRDTENLSSEEELHLTDNHVSWLRSHKDTKTIHVEGLDADRFTGDFYGLLVETSVDRRYHYTVLKVNGLLSSSDYDGKQQALVLPSMAAMDRVFTLYNSRAA